MKKLFFVFVAVILLVSLSFAVSDEEKAQNVLKKAAGRLGWPDSVTQDPDNKDSVGPQYYISSDGKGQDSDLRASVVVLPTEAITGFWMSFATEQADYDRTTYMGRDAGISKYGKNCNPKPLVKAINDFAVGWLESIFGESNDADKGCVTDHGGIIWACGKYLMIATDDRSTEGGMENDIAADLFAAAQEDKLCEYGSTLVILAATTDKPGAKKLADFEKIAQGVNEYYAYNTYGKQTFTYTFKDADGTKGGNDWYEVAPTQTGMSSKEYAEAAVKKVFEGGDVPQDLTFDRIVVVYSGKASQNDQNAVFSTADSWQDANYFIEVNAASRKAKIITDDLIMVSEDSDQVGDWSHEFGHSLWWKYLTDGKTNKINDRYNYFGKPNWQYGKTGPWDIMGEGNSWGNPNATKPTQMSSYTKEAAGWLTYATMTRNRTYNEPAMEGKKLGDIALQFDDPASADPLFFYVVEARDSSWTYSAPETGVVLYKVAYDHANTHEIVNDLQPQNGSRTSSKDGHDYDRPTLHGVADANGSLQYIDVPGNFKVILEGESSNPYSASIRLEDNAVANMTGAIVAPNGTPAIVLPASVGAVGKPYVGVLPDIDLHAYDNNGGHVGLNYQTGDYENTIPGAIGSGDLKNDQEWIFVPQGTQVRYEVSAHKTQEFLQKNPQYSQYAQPQGFETSLMKIDGAGKQFEADGGSGSVASGQTATTKNPDDPSLQYKEKINPGFGSNSLCPLLPGFLLLLAVGAFLKGRR